MSKGPKTHTTTSTMQVDPSVQRRYLELQNRIRGQQINPYGGEYASGLTPDELAARGFTREFLDSGVGLGAVGTGIGAAGNLTGWTPERIGAGQSTFRGVDTDAFADMLSGIPGARGVGVQAGTTSAGGVASDRDLLGYRGNVRDVSAMSGVDAMQQYMNPFIQGAIDPALNDLNRARQMALMGVGDQATAAGAFGGDRHGLLEGETNRGFADASARMIGDMRMRGFETAGGLAQSDAARMLQAQMANQGYDAQSAAQALGVAGQIGLSNAQLATEASRASAANQTQASLANQQAGLAKAGMLAGLEQYNASNDLANQQFNIGTALDVGRLNQQAGLAGAGINLGAANALGGLGSTYQGLGLGGAGFLSGLGQQERGIYDTNLQGQYADYLRQQNQRLQQLGMEQGTLASMPYGTTTTQSQPIYGGNPISGLLGGATGMAGLGLPGILGGPVGIGIGAGLGLLGSFF